MDEKPDAPIEEPTTEPYPLNPGEPILRLRGTITPIPSSSSYSIDAILLLIGDLRGSILYKNNQEGVWGNKSYRPRKPRTPPEVPKGFEEWYAIYPRKVQRKDAEDAFRHLMKTGVDINALMDATSMYATSVLALEPQYVKFPATFLRNERWRDYISAGPEHTMSGEERTAIRAKWESGEYSSELVMKLEQKYKVKII